MSFEKKTRPQHTSSPGATNNVPLRSQFWQALPPSSPFASQHPPPVYVIRHPTAAGVIDYIDGPHARAAADALARACGTSGPKSFLHDAKQIRAAIKAIHVSTVNYSCATTITMALATLHNRNQQLQTSTIANSVFKILRERMKISMGDHIVSLLFAGGSFDQVAMALVHDYKHTAALAPGVSKTAQARMKAIIDAVGATRIDAVDRCLRTAAAAQDRIRDDPTIDDPIKRVVALKSRAVEVVRGLDIHELDAAVGGECLLHPLTIVRSDGENVPVAMMDGRPLDQPGRGKIQGVTVEFVRVGVGHEDCAIWPEPTRNVETNAAGVTRHTDWRVETVVSSNTRCAIVTPPTKQTGYQPNVATWRVTRLVSVAQDGSKRKLLRPGAGRRGGQEVDGEWWMRNVAWLGPRLSEQNITKLSEFLAVYLGLYWADGDTGTGSIAASNEDKVDVEMNLIRPIAAILGVEVKIRYTTQSNVKNKNFRLRVGDNDDILYPWLQRIEAVHHGHRQPSPGLRARIMGLPDKILLHMSVGVLWGDGSDYENSRYRLNQVESSQRSGEGVTYAHGSIMRVFFLTWERLGMGNFVRRHMGSINNTLTLDMKGPHLGTLDVIYRKFSPRKANKRPKFIRVPECPGWQVAKAEVRPVTAECDDITRIRCRMVDRDGNAVMFLDGNGFVFDLKPQEFRISASSSWFDVVKTAYAALRP